LVQVERFSITKEDLGRKRGAWVKDIKKPSPKMTVYSGPSCNGPRVVQIAKGGLEKEK